MKLLFQALILVGAFATGVLGYNTNNMPLCFCSGALFVTLFWMYCEQKL